MKDKGKTKEQLLNELVELRQRNDELEALESQYEQTEKKLQAAYRFLEISFKHRKVVPLLKEFVAEVQSFSKCSAVGIRMLDEEGNIPYEAYEGFSKRFYELESPLSIKSDQCMCINVIKGSTDPKLPFFTEGGSFYMNGTTRFLATISEEEKGQTRNVCNEFGYESVALVPIRVSDSILGLIHVADSRENMVPLENVEVLEGVSMQLAVAIERVRTEEQIQVSLKEKEVLLQEIHHRVKNNLQIISSLCDMNSLRIHDQQALDLLTDVRTKVHTISLIHSQLYRSERFDRIEIGRHINELINYFSEIYRKGKDITPIVEVSNVYLSLTQAIPCALILNELISNVFKHAFKEGQKGKVEISMQRSAKDTIILRIKDNGIGIPEEVDIYKTDSLGLKLVRNLIQRQLNGKIQVNKKKGSEFFIKFQASKEEAKYV